MNQTMSNNKEYQISGIYGKQAYLCGCVSVPLVLFHEPAFEKLSMGARVLYGFLLEKMGRDSECRWLDEDDHIYIVYPVEKIMEDMNIEKTLAVQYINELENVRLLVCKSRGNGKSEALYPQKIKYFYRPNNEA